MKEAEKLFTKIFMLMNNRFSIVYSLRRVAELGLPYATKLLHGELHGFARELLTDPKHDNLFIDREAFLNKVGGINGLAKTMVTGQLESSKKAIDAASLIFAHSVLDNVAFEYCRVTSLVEPHAWEDVLLKKQVSLEAVKAGDYETILKEHIDRYFAELERRSLMEKIDRIFQLCKPPSNFSELEDYKYNRDRIKRLDALRHDYIHGEGPVTLLPKGGDDIWYLHQTGLHLMALINFKYNLRIIPEYAFDFKI